MNYVKQLAVLAIALAGQTVEPFDPVAEAPTRFAGLADLMPAPAPILAITDKEQDGLAIDGRVSVSAASLRAAHTRQELDGMLAILIAHAQPPSGYVEKPTWPTLPEIVGAGAATIIGEAVDPIRKRDYDQYGRVRQYGGPFEKEPAPMPGNARGRTALALMQKVGSCSGAALEVATRIARTKSGNAAPLPIQQLAQQARRDFGSLAAPPDTSCIP